MEKSEVKLFREYSRTSHSFGCMLAKTTTSLHRLQLSEIFCGKPHPPINADHTHRLITISLTASQLFWIGTEPIQIH